MGHVTLAKLLPYKTLSKERSVVSHNDVLNYIPVSWDKDYNDVDDMENCG